MALGRPSLSYVPIISTGCGSSHGFALKLFIIIFCVLLIVFNKGTETYWNNQESLPKKVALFKYRICIAPELQSEAEAV
jgi:hypothetical protein